MASVSGVSKSRATYAARDARGNSQACPSHPKQTRSPSARSFARSARMAAPQTEVVITVAGVETGRFVLAPGDYVIGRNQDCAIRVDADLVSRQHAKLILNYDHSLIEDLGSSNGTSVNDQPVTETTRLWPNQKIQVGTATIDLRRLKVEVSDMSLAPAQAVMKRVAAGGIPVRKKIRHRQSHRAKRHERYPQCE